MTGCRRRVRNLLRPPKAALIAGGSCGCRRARLFASITGSSGGRGNNSFRSSLYVSRKSTVSACCDEGRVMRPRPSQLSETHDDGARGANDSAPQRFQTHQLLLCFPCLVQFRVVQLIVPNCLRPRCNGLDSARTNRVALVHREPPRERSPSVPGRHRPT